MHLFRPRLNTQKIWQAEKFVSYIVDKKQVLLIFSKHTQLQTCDFPDSVEDFELLGVKCGDVVIRISVGEKENNTD